MLTRFLHLFYELSEAVLGFIIGITAAVISIIYEKLGGKFEFADEG